MISSYTPLLCALAVLAPFSGCSRDSDAAALATRVVDSAGGTVALGLSHTAYRSGASRATGILSGRVTLQGTAPADSTVPVTRDPRTCGDSINMNEVETQDGGIANVLVWIDGVTEGKPLPELRRAQLTIDHCRFEPRVIAVVAPSTINVFSRDRAVYETRFYREGGVAVDSIRTVDEGQVVPTERVASTPGIVEARDALHPWTRGYVAVFAHPYFAVTNATGTFRIDGLAPGTYTMKIWHERLPKPIEQRVVIGEGGTGRADVALALP